MPLKQCTYCDEYFNGVSELCPNCSKSLDEIFAKVKKFIYSSKTEVSIAEITEALDVPEKAVGFLIDKGRLTTEHIGMDNKCRLCGAPIPSNATYCKDCINIVNKDLGKFKNEVAELKQAAAKTTKEIQPLRGLR